jgi:hypothetical protein
MPPTDLNKMSKQSILKAKLFYGKMIGKSMSNRRSFSLNHFAIKLFCHGLFYPLAAVIRWATFFNLMLPRPWLRFSA